MVAVRTRELFHGKGFRDLLFQMLLSSAAWLVIAMAAGHAQAVVAAFVLK